MMSRSALAIIGVSADVLLVGGWLADWLGRIAGCPQLLQKRPLGERPSWSLSLRICAEQRVERQDLPAGRFKPLTAPPRLTAYVPR
jgi:hypothetical protein